MLSHSAAADLYLDQLAPPVAFDYFYPPGSATPHADLFFFIGVIRHAARRTERVAAAFPISAPQRDRVDVDRIGNLRVRGVRSRPGSAYRATAIMLEEAARIAVQFELDRLFSRYPTLAVRCAPGQIGRSQGWLRDRLTRAALAEASRVFTLPFDVRKKMGLAGAGRPARVGKATAARATTAVYRVLRQMGIHGTLGTPTTFENAFRAWKKAFGASARPMWAF